MTSEFEGRCLADVVSARARELPDRPALRVEDDTLTYAELDDRARRVATGLRASEVAPGDVVAVMLPNCTEFVVTWLALDRLGAATAAVNTALIGDGLAHALATTGARVLVLDEDHVGAARDILDRLPGLRTVLLRGTIGSLPGVRLRPWATLLDHAPMSGRGPVSGADASIVLFTSGSTGRSKACVLPHRYVVRQAEVFARRMGLRGDDVLFCPFPLFHVDAAVFTVAPAFLLGATAALVRRFSVRRFWDQIRAAGATVFDFMGATLAMLYKQPAGPGDRTHAVRLAWGVPLPAWAGDFEDRFGVELVEPYGLTDTGMVLSNEPGVPRRPGSCGRPIELYEVRVLDADGFELPAGRVGEICVRPREPAVMFSAYLGMPEETLSALRDLWFHTGDLAHRDADGYFYFAGRAKDVIRRRGENISALEIEEVIDRHPAVLEAAAYGVPSELTEEDVMVAIVLRPGRSLAAEELLEFCARNLARHMVPRYLDFVAELPKTPTEKIEKHRLKTRGVTGSTHDRGSGGHVSSREDGQMIT
ncbi:AMP-binding protein [Actinomadura sp. HBU206391]|uniref:AMP-binding protein n=1 Tax=Actinomadura sp. HBU206391 TaxID=2731692 RepID=UPI0016500D00|nr:AMP-binding protein [Actinomadura sp. HBU206391]MBC6460825.1 AMP-binding protein [Actinomadura sp. HBU206391]